MYNKIITSKEKLTATHGFRVNPDPTINAVRLSSHLNLISYIIKYLRQFKADTAYLVYERNPGDLSFT